MIKTVLKKLQRYLGATPMCYVLKELNRRAVFLGEMDALEVFGYIGEYHTQDYIDSVASLEVWEIRERCYDDLKRNLPGAQIRITDSFAEVRRTTKRFDLVVVDNPMSLYGGHCEHFDLFPDVFRVLSASSILIVNVIPEANEVICRRHPDLFRERQLEARAQFYRTHQPEKVPFDKMMSCYRELGRANGFELEWHFVKQRSCFYRRKGLDVVYYVVMKLQRS